MHSFPIDGPIPTFTAYRVDTGERITVDIRTFDLDTMSRVWPVVEPVVENVPSVP